ncbi:hypothetical protein OEA41_008386 [Lepraria neglecta]|uniref:Uncharacterized protein n=1 Tax=Lepraria neglecta TaxID=209136 RepID=A0AAE0DP32_9LECA|nr:hypothetical protein OEA41_008386 [Lepraria neglecta]
MDIVISCHSLSHRFQCLSAGVLLLIPSTLLITAPTSTNPPPHRPDPRYLRHPESSAEAAADRREHTSQPSLDRLPHYHANLSSNRNAFHRLSTTQLPPPQNHQPTRFHLFLIDSDAGLGNFFLSIDTARTSDTSTYSAHVSFHLTLITTTVSSLFDLSLFISNNPQLPLLNLFLNRRLHLVRLPLPLLLLLLKLSAKLVVTEEREREKAQEENVYDDAMWEAWG